MTKSIRMGVHARNSKGSASCCTPLIATSVALLVMSMNIITVQAISRLKDNEVEAYLNRVNKPAVKSMVMNGGDIIDCVDMYKQPGLDHPLLTNHKIKTPPSSLPTMANVTKPSSALPTLQQFLQNGEECPEGTVAIRRVQKSDLIHVKSLTGYGIRDNEPTWKMVERAGLIARGAGFIGATGMFNVWPVWVENNEWSHTDVELSDLSQQNFVEGGYLVHPGLYGDNRTRLYAYWTADGYGSTGCYNVLCPGFIQISSKVPLGGAIEPLSVYGGQQYEITIIIIKDEARDAWWLSLNSHYVGYWPIDIFEKQRFEEISIVKLIGSVLNKRNGGQHTATHMGSGHFPDEGWGKAAFIRESRVSQDPKRGFFYPPSHWYEPIADNPKCYDAKSDLDKHVIYYGGPGLGAEGCT